MARSALDSAISDVNPAKFAAYADAPSLRPMASERKLFGQRKGGAEFPVEISLSPLETDGERLFICTIRDNSGRL
jgi:two-component system sensor kinase FixL